VYVYRTRGAVLTGIPFRWNGNIWKKQR